MENTVTHLHNVLGDDNVLTVKFEDVRGVETYCNDVYSTYKGIAKDGIMVGLRRYRFFGGSFFLLIFSWSFILLLIQHFSLLRCQCHV